MLHVEAAVKTPCSDVLDADGAGAAARSPQPPPVGALTPGNAEATRQERAALETDATNGNDGDVQEEEIFQELEQPGSVPLTLPVFNHGCNTALEYSGLEEESSTSDSAVHDATWTSSCSVCPAAVAADAALVLHLREEDRTLLEGPMAVRLAAVRYSRDVDDDEVDEDNAAEVEGERGRGRAMGGHTDRKWKFTLGYNIAAGQGLRRTHARMADGFLKTAEDASHDHGIDAGASYSLSQSLSQLDTLVPILDDSCSCILNGAVQPETTEDPTVCRNVKKFDAWSRESDIQRCSEFEGALGESLQSIESFLRHFSNMPADAAPYPPQEERHCAVPPVADAPPPALVAYGSLPSDAKPAADSTSIGKILAMGATSVALRYMFPQPLMYGSRLPPLLKMDPLEIFCGDCLSTAPWVISPRNVPTEDDDDLVVIQCSVGRRTVTKVNKRFLL
ncbi:hypothetical protein STCU_10009 [Strigomonas culicis]|uniref:Uncharacterized protein n=1 Tax=Strigomonas culicis TaxID=28005 RepID=S9V632_9TRYP|nr:hypothetical protein STCU_10009 [Strigomonas culicis]|eukprot:EPY18370.1 hypothetical protein STCU_10009 [Strigomonas culicis]